MIGNKNHIILSLQVSAYFENYLPLFQVDLSVLAIKICLGDVAKWVAGALVGAPVYTGGFVRKGTRGPPVAATDIMDLYAR